MGAGDGSLRLALDCPGGIVFKPRGVDLVEVTYWVMMKAGSQP